jgi:tetratricopeptide (TPR) repeat protein
VPKTDPGRRLPSPGQLYIERARLFIMIAVYDALGKWQEAMAVNRTLGDISSLAMLHNNIGHIYLVKKEFKRSLEHLSRSLKLKTQLELTGYLPSTHNALARVYLELSRASGRRSFIRRALEHVDRGRKIARSLNIRKDIESGNEIRAEIGKARDQR